MRLRQKAYQAEENMYLEHWNLNLLPFENVPNPAFFYPSPTHEEALERLKYAVFYGKGAAMISGGVGCGKTILSRALIKNLERERYHVAAMTNPLLAPVAFLHSVMCSFKESYNHAPPKTMLWNELEDRLKRNMENGNGSVLIIDEAQSISDKRTLEELRMLLNLQTDDKFMLTLILLGQLELEQLVEGVEPLKQRIAIKYRLNPLSPPDVSAYIGHRLRIAGRNQSPFSDEAMETIYACTKGVPRDINNLCDRSLLAAYLGDTKTVDKDLVDQAWQDLH
jgi:general secretion pathway protein A